jgi:MFS family permease
VAVTSIRGRRFNPFSLDAVNFLLADVRGALGPYLNVFLVTQQHWSQSEVGLVTTIGGLLGLVVQTPIGAAIDETRAKRGAIVLGLVVLGIGAAIIFTWPRFWPVAIANSLMAIVGDVFGPAVAALTLGLYARKQLARRMGRNSAFDHAGNVAIAVTAGAVGYVFSQRAVFLLVPVFALLAAIAVLSIPARAIDLDRARDLDRDPDAAATETAPAGYAILPIRAVLYTLSDNSVWLIGVQVLDGVGAGIFGALTPLVIADIMRGTGRYNLAQGAVATLQGIGASCSGLAAGVIVDGFGYSAAFLAAGAAALVALAVFALGMPETAEPETVSPSS